MITHDDIVIELGEGTYMLDCCLSFNRHNVTIRGLGSDKTTLIVPANIQYGDDAIINLQGLYQTTSGQESDIKISVSISGLTIRTDVTKAQAEQKHEKLTQHESYIIKCYNVGSFVMRDVRIIIENIASTCLDIRRGFNIDIRECEFINRNRRWTGGNIWLRGDIENAVIEDNDFYKYGNDEAIAVYGSNSFVGYNVSTAVSKRNINIRHNRFFYQDTNGGADTGAIINEGANTWDGINQRLIAFITNQDDNKIPVNNSVIQSGTPCSHTINGIHFENNEIHINAPISHHVTVAFDKYTVFKDISIRNNIISYGNWSMDNNSGGWKELMDFCVYFDTQYGTELPDTYDQFSDEPVFITGNTITCGSHARNIYGDGQYDYQDNHMCLDIKGTSVVFNNNLVNCTRGSCGADEQSFARKGIELLHCGSKGGKVFMRDNHCLGLRALARLTAAGASIVKADIHCSGNHFQGDTRITYVNVTESHLFIVNNEFISDYPIFYLEEFAITGTAMFTGNRVYRDLTRVGYYTTPQGHIYYTGSPGSNNNQSIKFIICDNVFDNIIGSTMYSFLQSSPIQVIHKDNLFSATVE